MSGYRRDELSRSNREVVYLCADGGRVWCEMEDLRTGQITPLEMPAEPVQVRKDYRQYVWRYGTPAAAAAVGLAVGLAV